MLAVVIIALTGLPAAAAAANAPTFSSTSYPACLRPSWVEPIDVTGDGALDLVVSGEGDDSVVVLRGDGRGGFTFLSSVPSGGDGPYSLDVAELTGDGRDDVAVVNRWSKTVTVLAGDGTGGFTLRSSIAVGTEPIDVKAMDLDEDGDLDVVSCNMWTTYLNLLINDGSGRLSRVDVPLPYKGATVLGYGDLNADGHVDVAIGHYWETSATVLLGDGHGGLSVGASLPVGPYPTGAVFADFNDDGHQDVIVASRYPNNANVFLGDGTGAFSGPTRYGVGPFAKVLAPADYNLDGTLDVAVCNWGADGVVEDTVSMLTGHGDGTFDPEVRILVGDKPHSVATADLNGDGRPDLVTPNTDTNDVTVLLNTTPVTQLDTTPPTTSSTADTAWHRSGVTVTLNASDDLSGVAATYYRVDGGQWRSGTGVQVSGDGVHALEFYSVDVAGNTEDVRNAQVKIDGTAPSVTVTAPSDGATYVQGTAVTAGWTSADALSGVAGESATVDDQPVAKGARLDTLAPGGHAFSLTVTDAAGNATTRTAQFTVSAVPVPDTTPPTTTARFTGTAGADGWWTGASLLIDFAADDGGGAGVAATWYCVRAEGQPAPAWPADYTQGSSLAIATADGVSDGRYTLYFRSSDLADPANLEQVRTTPVKIDATRPATSSSADDAWHRTAVTLTLTPGDALSGVASTLYRVDGAAWQPGTSVPVSGDGVHSVEFYSVDVAGNAEAVKSAQVKIDGTPPVTASTADAAWHAAPLTVSLTPSDALSGVAATSWRLDGGPWQAGSSVPVSGEGVHLLEFSSLDAAGNQEPVRTAQVKIDQTLPTVALVTPTDGASYLQGVDATVAWTSADTLSGVATQTATVDGKPVAIGDRLDTLAPGGHEFVVTVTDAAGNTRSATARFTVVAGLTVTEPNGGETLTIRTKTTVSWTFSAPIPNGFFGLWAVSESGAATSLGTAAANGSTSYSKAWRVNVPAGRYRIQVSYGASKGDWTVTDFSDGLFTVVR